MRVASSRSGRKKTSFESVPPMSAPKKPPTSSSLLSRRRWPCASSRSWAQQPTANAGCTKPSGACSVRRYMT
jgi:hypothetical protein